jgi:hypothetical protein
VANLVGDEKHIVVIENQFGRTNHDHLAKLLTYAAARKAMTGIWIAEEVADDHRQVIDWLNENTPDTVALYDRKRREWRIAFWQDIHHWLKAEKIPFRLQKPGPGHWSSIAIGRSGFHVSMLLTPKNQSVVLEMIVQPAGWKDSAFEQLLLQAKEIKAEVGKPLQWRLMPDKSCSKILLEEKLDPDVEGNRKKICEWFAEWTPKVYLAFQDRVKKLVAPEEA